MKAGTKIFSQGAFICIEGNIGIGKTNLVQRLSGHFNSFSLFEEFEDNPWLPLFYKDPNKMALAAELSFLMDRGRQLLNTQKQPRDKLLFSDYCLDKSLLFSEVNLSKENFTVYKKLHSSISSTIRAPDLVIILHAPATSLIKNIKQRNRDYEQNTSPAYLEKLNTAYKTFFGKRKSYPVLNIFTEELNKKIYDQIFDEVVSYLQKGSSFKNKNIEL
jgi:deoxyguanosine kinase